MVNAIPWEVLMPSTKCEGLRYPTHFLKNRGSVIRNNFLEFRTKQATFVVRQNDFMHWSLQIKQNIYMYSIGIFSCSCSDTIYSKSMKKNRKKFLFFKKKVYHFSISQHFLNVKMYVVRAVIT